MSKKTNKTNTIISNIINTNSTDTVNKGGSMKKLNNLKDLCYAIINTTTSSDAAMATDYSFMEGVFMYSNKRTKTTYHKDEDARAYVITKDDVKLVILPEYKPCEEEVDSDYEELSYDIEIDAEGGELTEACMKRLIAAAKKDLKVKGNYEYLVDNDAEIEVLEDTEYAMELLGKLNNRKYFDPSLFEMRVYGTFLYGDLCDNCQNLVNKGVSKFKVSCPVCDQREERVFRRKDIPSLWIDTKGLTDSNVSNYLADELNIRDYPKYDNNFIVISGAGVSKFTDVRADDDSVELDEEGNVIEKPFHHGLVQLSNILYIRPCKPTDSETRNFNFADRVAKSAIATGKASIELDRSTTGMWQDYETLTAEVNRRTDIVNDEKQKAEEFAKTMAERSPSDLHKEILPMLINAINTCETEEEAIRVKDGSLDVFFRAVNKEFKRRFNFGKGFYRDHFRALEKAIEVKFPHNDEEKAAYDRITGALDKIEGNDFCRKLALVTSKVELDVNDIQPALNHARKNPEKRFSKPIFTGLITCKRNA